MSKPMGKTGKRLLIALLILVLLGGCFGAVALYAKNEINKPRFQMPEIAPLPSATALPTEKAALADYLNGLYAAAVTSDEAEGSWRTDVDLGGNMDLPFAHDDNAVISLIRDGAAGEFASLYPSASNVRMDGAENAPALQLDPNAITEFTAEQGRTDEEGEVTDDGIYFVDLTMDPASVDAAAFTSGEIYEAALAKLSAAVSAAEVTAEVQSCYLHFKIDRIADRLLNAEIHTELRFTADVTLTDAYAPLLEGTAQTRVVLPYKTTQHVDFSWYGARFLERAIAAKAGDMTALPADVKVNEAAMAGEDFTLTFTPSDPNALSIDADGVMTVHKAPEETATVTMTLEYRGHTYTDELIVYITELELEVENNG